MDPVNPSDARVNSVLDQGGVRKNPLGIPRPYFADIKYLMTQTENRPRLSDEEIIDLLKNPKLFGVSNRVQAHKDYWGQKEKEADKVKADKAIAKEKAEAASPGGNTPTPVTGNAAPAQGTPTPTGNASSKALQANPEFDSGQPFEAIGPKSDGWDTDKFLKVFPKITVNGKTQPDFSNPRFFYVGGVTPIEITKEINAGYEPERILKQFAIAATGVASGGGGGGYIAPATTYSIQQIGGKVYSIGSDGKRELTDIDPGYAKYEVNRLGDLYGFRADGTSTKLQSGWDFAKQDPALVVQKDSRTGESFLVNTRDPSQPKQSLGTFDFATIDPERTAAEAALQSRLGLAASERAGDQSAALSGRATDIGAASNARTQDISLQGQQFNNALDLQKYVNGLINNPTDFVNRGRLSAGLAPLGGGRITQADLVNAAKNAMGSQNFQTVRDAVLPAPFVTAPKTAIPDFSKPAGTTPTGTTPTVPAIPLMPTGGAVSQADFDRMQAYTRNQPAPVNPVNPNQNTWTVGQNPTTQEQVLINMQNANVPNFMIQQQLQSMGLMPAPAPVSTPVTSSQNTQMLSSDNAPDAGPLGAPAAASAPATAQESAEYFAGRDDLSSTFGDAGPAVTSDDTSFTDYAYGGATRDERFIVGDRRDGRPAGTEEMIINPTRAPIQVVPNSRLAAYYGGTMPDRFAGGTDSRLGMYPRYAEGNQPTQDAISQYLRIMGDAGRLKDAYDVLAAAKISYQPSAAESARYFASQAGLSSTFGGGGAAVVPQNAVAQQNYPSVPSSVPAPRNQFDFPDGPMMGGTQPNYNAPTPPGYGQQPAYDQQPQQRQSFSPDVTPYYPDPYSRYDPTTRTLYQLLPQEQRGFDYPQGADLGMGQGYASPPASALSRIGPASEYSFPDEDYRSETGRYAVPRALQTSFPPAGIPQGPDDPENEDYETFPYYRVPPAVPRSSNGLNAQQPFSNFKELPRIGPFMPGIRGVMPRYADGVLPSVQGAPAGSLSPVTQEDLVNTAREYSPPAVSSLLGDRGAFEARMLPVQSASMRQTNNLTADEAAALGTRLALEGTSQQEYNALQKGLFGQQRTTRRGRLVV